MSTKPEAAAPAPLSEPRPTVLLVDDDADIRQSMEDSFELMLPDVALVTASTAAQGLKLLRKRLVHVIVADYHLPGQDGLSFLREARSLAPGARTMMLTGFPSPELALQARTLAGVTMVIAKPVDAKTLLGTIDFLLGRTSKVPGDTKAGRK